MLHGVSLSVAVDTENYPREFVRAYSCACCQLIKLRTSEFNTADSNNDWLEDSGFEADSN